jgi:predicted permease
MTLHSAWLRICWLLRRNSRERELDEELLFHMEQQTEALLRTGLTPEEAARQVRLEFGGLDKVKEECRDAHGTFLESIWSDIRYGLRTLRKTRVFTLTALLSLTLGIGINTTLFTILDYLLWRPLAVRDADRLYAFRSPGPNLGGVMGTDWTMAFSYPVYHELQEHSTTMEWIMARFMARTSVAWHGRTEYMGVEFTSGNFFDLLGVTPISGRFFTAGEDRDPGAHPVAVLSHAAWLLKFGGDPSIVGQTININRVPVTIIGISGKSFIGAMRQETADIRMPLAMYDVLGKYWNLRTHDFAWLNMVGRLKPGVSLQQAGTELNLIYRNILKAEADSISHTWPMREQFLARQIELAPANRGVIWDADLDIAGLAMMGLVGCVLLIACTNITGLLLARNLACSRELAVRVAVGAGRFRIIRQLLTESLLLSIGGGLCGFFTAYVSSPALLKLFLSAEDLYNFPGKPDLRVGLFTIGVSLAVTLFIGLVPSLRAAPDSVQTDLRSDTTTTAGASHLRFRSALVIVEIALAVCLTAVTWLAARTLHNLRNTDMGFREEGIVTFAVNATLEGYPREKAAILYENLKREISNAPDVRSVAMTDLGIMDHSGNQTAFEAQNGQIQTGEAKMYHVSPGYFRVLGTSILAGHEFEHPRDSGVLVNRTFARRFFGNRTAIGSHIRSTGSRNWMEIIGVVADEKHYHYRENPMPYVHFPYQVSDEACFYIKIAENSPVILSNLRVVTERIAPGVPIRGFATLTQHIDEEMKAETAMNSMLAAFCVLAALLMAVGVYGITSYNVARRIRELAIRIALGARILTSLLKHTALLIVLGTCAGLAVSVVLTYFIRSYVYGIDAADPLSLSAACLTVIVTAIAATFLPAWRATRIDPMQALRLE